MSELDPLRWARYYASVKHTGQTYVGGVPYTHHLAEVDAVLVRFGVTDLDMRTAAWLHDLVEDTGTSLKEVAEMFGERVAALVAAVTDELGENRRVRKALTYPKTRAVPGAVCLKLADRIANLERGGRLVETYRKEQDDFKRSLYTPGEYEEMWLRVEELLVPPRDDAK